MVKLVLENLGGAFPDAGSPFVRGLERLSDIVGSLFPEQPRTMSRLESGTQRARAAPTWDAKVGEELVAELERSYLDANKDYAHAFRVAHLLSKVEERRARYAAALQWCDRAFHIASALAIDGSPLIRESLVALCEAAGDACLNIGRPTDWERAHEFFARALDERRKLQQELNLKVAISEQHDTEAIFQLARYSTHKREFAKAEKRYNEVLERATQRSNHVLRAHALKELADNYRVADKTRQMRSTFRQALQAYADVPRRALKDDPALEIELHLNVAYCQRRLDDEPKAVKAFVSALKLAHERRDARRVSMHACSSRDRPSSRRRPGTQPSTRCSPARS